MPLLLKSKLRKLSNKMGVQLKSASHESYGHKVVLENGETLYRDKKGWLHYEIPTQGPKS